ncbi:hypothetical protein C1646_770624 [Rhizophagus diaphanus]|nr:hypothetical protein C1646_770624 [Rhizophagus diaphanus] [Rhizophagus sp. MUCL 43196]
MSCYRQACIDHHKHLEIFDNVKNIVKPDTLPTSSSWKGQHALIYLTNCLCRKRYRKLTVFNADKDHPDAISKINDRLASANRKRFLFLTTQHINSPINHLKYKECNPKRDNYPFPIPIHSTKVIDKKNPKNAHFAIVSNSRSTNPRHKPPSSTFHDNLSFSHSKMTEDTTATILTDTAAAPTPFSGNLHTNSTLISQLKLLLNLFEEVSSTSDDYETADSSSDSKQNMHFLHFFY